MLFGYSDFHQLRSSAIANQAVLAPCFAQSPPKCNDGNSTLHADKRHRAVSTKVSDSRWVLSNQNVV